MSYQSFACFLFATLRYVKILTQQNPEQLFVAQVLKRLIYNSVAELRE